MFNTLELPVLEYLDKLKFHHLWIAATMNCKSLTLTLMLFANYSFADKLTIYRWVDKDNIVHFSQHQPAHDDYVEISMSDYKNAVNNSDNDDAVVETLKASVVDDKALAQASLSKCDTAKENLKVLRGFEKIQFKDENGKTQVLGDVEKQQQLEMNKKQAEVYCK